MIRLGILGCSDIAYKRFMPAAQNVKELQVVAVAEEYDRAKIDLFCKEYGLEDGDSFEKMIRREDIDSIYIPQPPALHYKWAKAALEQGKHVLLEKPSTTEYILSKELTDLAGNYGLALHENYMFQYHSQIEEIKKILADGVIGDVRLMKANFGFPMRANNDFRYKRELGGGALLDAGGYTVKLAAVMLGDSVKVDAAKLNYLPNYEVDMYGSASLSNSNGVVFQVGFGMDCAYQCGLEVWGSKGRLRTNRIFTAPDGYRPQVSIEIDNEEKVFDLAPDSHFQHSIERFLKEITDLSSREKMYEEIMLQSRLVDDIRRIGEN